jgi:hypothetical protein
MLPGRHRCVTDAGDVWCDRRHRDGALRWSAGSWVIGWEGAVLRRGAAGPNPKALSVVPNDSRRLLRRDNGQGS